MFHNILLTRRFNVLEHLHVTFFKHVRKCFVFAGITPHTTESEFELYY